MTEARDKESKPVSALEGHVRTGMQAITIAILLWFGSAMIEVKTSVAVIESDMLTLKNSIQSAYSNSAALRDHSEVTRRLDRLESRVDGMDQRAKEARGD